MSISLSVGSTSAIANFSALKSTVSDWLDRDDLAAQLPVFILMAEAQFNRELRTSEMEVTTTFSALSEDTTLPVDYLAMRAIYVEGSPDRPMNAKSPAALRREYDGSVGTPDAYALVSGGIRLAPPPASEISLTMDYFAAIESLSDAAPSNWLLEKHPDVYLYGTLFHAETFLDNATRAGQWKGLLEDLLGKINRSANANRWGGGPLIPNTVRQVRGARS